MKVEFSNILVHNQILWSENEEGKVVVSFLQNHWIQRFFRKYFRMRIPAQKNMVLDERTSCIWKLIDGQKTLKEIYDLFALQIEEQQTEDLKVRFGTVIHYFISQKWVVMKEENHES